MTQRRDNGHWEPPGGVLELDESILDGARREVREETGLHIEPERLIPRVPHGSHNVREPPPRCVRRRPYPSPQPAKVRRPIAVTATPEQTWRSIRRPPYGSWLESMVTAIEPASFVMYSSRTG